MSSSYVALAFSISFLASLILSVGHCHGNDLGPSELELTTERAIVFKDGYCLIVKNGTATTDENGFVFTEKVPDAAILGSFWAIPENGKIKSMIAGWSDVKTETKRTVNCKSVVEIVAANLGSKCSFHVSEKERIEGTLLRILSNDMLDANDAEAARQRTLRQASILSPGSTPNRFERASISATTGQFFVVRTDQGDTMVAANSVRNLTIDNMNSTIEQTVTKESRRKRLAIDFGTPNTEIKLKLIYFRPGVRWIPTYRVNLTENAPKNNHQLKAAGVKTAELAMQGEIINEAEDLVNVPVHVVVGVPNFRFRSIPSPMVLESSLRNALAQAAPNFANNGFSNMSNALYTQRSSEFRSNRAAGSTARSDVELPKELSSSGGNDLFVYKLASMTLRKGERATVPILKTEVAYRDIYTWEINVPHSESYSNQSGQSNSPLVLTENKIWRQIELINNTELPWTTGAAMFTDGFQPVAQELLTYTSPGGICRVPVTVSVDLRGQIDDREINRELKALRWRNNNYARVNGKIGVELTNNKSHNVSVEVKLRFGGKANKASDAGTITLDSYRANDWKNNQGDRINNSSLIRWDATVAPGECFKPTVDYEFWLRY